MLGAVGKGATSAARFRRNARWAPAARRAVFPKILYATTLSWACAHPLHAAETGYGIGLSLTSDSNITRVATNPRREVTQQFIVGLFYRQDTDEVSVRILTQVERRRFLRHTFASDTGGFLDEALVWRILPRRVSWSLEDAYREVQVNITAPAIPTNVAKSNTLSTGPDITFALNSANSAVVGGRYGQLDVPNTNLHNRRYTGFVRGVHALSTQTKLSLNYEATRMYFGPGPQTFPNILRQDWFGSFENRSPINDTVIDVGTSRVGQYGGTVAQCQGAGATPSLCSAPREHRGRFVRISTTEELSTRSRGRVAISDQISDTYTDLLGAVTNPTAPRDVGAVVVTGTNLATGDLYRSKRGELAYTNDDGRFGYTVQGYRRLVNFETLGPDYQETGGTFYWSWISSGSLRFNLSAIYTKRVFPSIDRHDADRTYSVGEVYLVTGHLTTSLSINRIERQSTAPVNNYRDNQVILVLGYTSGFTDIRSRR